MSARTDWALLWPKSKALIARAIVVGLAFLSIHSLAARTTDPEAPPVLSIQDAVRPNPVTLISDRLGETVKLKGVLTSDPVILGTSASLTSLQDETGGIVLFTPDTNLLAGHFKLGDAVEVLGIMGQYKGQEQLNIKEIHCLGPGQVPPPRDVLAADLLKGHFKGQLVRVAGELVVPAGILDREHTFVVRDRSGSIPLYVSPRHFSNPSFADRLMRGGSVEIVGIAAQIKDQPPYDSGYRVLPRDADDFRFARRPPYNTVAISAALALLVGLTAYFWLRRRRAEQRAQEMAALTESLRRSEKALRLSEERFAKAFRLSPDAIAISSLEEDRYVDVNDSFLRLAGCTREEVIGASSWEIGIGVNDGQRAWFMQRLHREKSLRDVEVSYRRKTGETRVGLVSAEIIELEGKPYLLTVGRDITERKEAERKLAERTTYLNALIENSPLGIVVRDAQARIKMCNPAFERLFQRRQSEILGADLDEIVSSGETGTEPYDFTRRVLAGEIVHATTRRCRKDGVLLDVELYSVPLIVHGELVGCYTLYQDITESKALEEQLRQAQKLEAVGRLAGGVAHDFNNLLMVIRGHAELLAERASSDDPQARSVEQIQRAVQRAASLTQQLLAYSRRQVIEPKVLDINQVVAEMAKMLPRLVGEDITLAVSCVNPVSPVRADRGQIEQVLLNLAVNARDAMPQGGKLTIETSSVALGEADPRRPRGLASGRYVMLAVKDTGTGMDKETQSHIFEPFFTTKEVGKGTGLGLATVFGIIQQNHGHIEVESKLGHGSVFRIYLPQVEQAVEDSAAPVATRKAPDGSGTILLVEDEDAVRELVRGSLERNGYTVLEASDGAGAERLANQHSGAIDLLITDVVMPGMSGKELAKRLGARRPNMRILYVSGYTEEAILHHGVLDEGTIFLQKPFRPADLAVKVRELLDNTKAKAGKLSRLRGSRAPERSHRN